MAQIEPPALETVARARYTDSNSRQERFEKQ
jgi:hypothetical protein